MKISPARLGMYWTIWKMKGVWFLVKFILKKVSIERMKHYIDLRDKEGLIICSSLGHIWKYRWLHDVLFRSCQRCKQLERKVKGDIWRIADISVESV